MQRPDLFPLNEGESTDQGYNEGMPHTTQPATPAALRSPRFRRIDPPPFELTARDLDILRAHGRHGVLRSTHVDRLFPEDSGQQMRRRLRLLYHAGFLERPRAQLATMLLGEGTRHYAHTLTRRGARLLGSDRLRVRVAELDAPLPYLEHDLGVADFMVACEVGCRELAADGLAFVSFATILQAAPLATQGDRTPGEWKVDIRYRNHATRRRTVRPDGIFGLSISTTTKFYFLERDTGTMDVVSRDPDKPSLLRKLYCYAETYRAAVHTSRYAQSNMRTLFVVPSCARADNLIRAFQEIVARDVSGISARLFLVIDEASLYGAAGGFFRARWRDMDGVQRLLIE